MFRNGTPILQILPLPFSPRHATSHSRSNSINPHSVLLNAVQECSPSERSVRNKKVQLRRGRGKAGKTDRGQGRLQQKNKSVRRNMKIEVHPRMHEQPQAGDQGPRVIGKVSRIAFHIQNFPGHPKKDDQKNEPAKAADRACFGKSLGVIVMAVIYDEAVIIRFVERKDFLQGAQTRSEDTVILKDAQAVVGHFHAAPLDRLQRLVAGKPVECGADSQP